MAGEGEFVAEHAHGRLAVINRNTAARTKCRIAKGAAVFRQRYFGVRATVEIVEDRPGDSSLGQPAKILDIDDGRRVELAVWYGHASSRDRPRNIIRFPEELLRFGCVVAKQEVGRVADQDAE